MKILSNDDRSFLIGASVKDEEKVEMLLFLVQNVDMFAWSPYEVRSEEHTSELQSLV